MLNIDGNHTIFQASLPGDANLDGTYNGDDMQILLGFNDFNDGLSTHIWQEFDFTGDGYVDASDMQMILGANSFNQTVTAHPIDNTFDFTSLGGTPAGIFLTKGWHDFQYDYLERVMHFQSNLPVESA